MSVKHKVMSKNFETKIRVNNRELPLNHFVQETLANVMVGFLKTLKETGELPRTIEIKISRLTEPASVDAHVYP